MNIMNETIKEESEECIKINQKPSNSNFKGYVSDENSLFQNI